MTTETSAESTPKGAGFRFTRIAIVIVLAGGWLAVWLDKGALTDVTVLPGSPHPEVALVEWESQLPFGAHRDGVVAAGVTLWERSHDPQTPLILFSAIGAQGERAVRLAMRLGDSGTHETIGYAQRIPGEPRWRWLNDEETRALEVAAATRSMEAGPTGSLRAAPPAESSDP